MADEPKKQKLGLGMVWRESKDLLWAQRRRLAIGLGLFNFLGTSFCRYLPVDCFFPTALY